MAREVIEQSEGRRVFGRDPAGYERGRPGHPERVYEVLRERCGLRRGARVLEIGPGTGQATRRLLELGANPLVAVAPDPILADYLPSMTGGMPEILVATLEDVELPEASFDLAVAPPRSIGSTPGPGLSAIFLALRSRGWWAMWWTHFGDRTRPDPFRDAIDHVVGGLAASPGASGFATDEDAARAALANAGFEACEHELVRWSHECDASAIRALFATFSPIARLEERRREAILDDVAHIASDEFGGRVVKPVVTSLYTARGP
jgi:SAM-dependent methyltransferase